MFCDLTGKYYQTKTVEKERRGHDKSTVQVSILEVIEEC